MSRAAVALRALLALPPEAVAAAWEALPAVDREALRPIFAEATWDVVGCEGHCGYHYFDSRVYSGYGISRL